MTVALAPPFARTRARRQPVWPAVALLGGYPVLWLLGFGAVGWIVLPAAASLSLALRRRLLAPPGFLVWVAFVGWMLLSVVMVEQRSQLLGFGLRAGYYLGATVVVLDLVNGRERLDAARIHRLLVVLWLAVVAGGLLGVVLPHVTVPSLAASLLPAEVQRNEFVQELITPRFAEVQNVRGVEIARPAAPFTYTNAWGAAYALLVPFAVAALARPVPGVNRRLVGVALALSAVPVVLSLNRGLWFGLALAGCYVAARNRPAARLRLGVGLAVVALVIGGLVAWTPAGGRAVDSLSVRAADSDDTRSALIAETIEEVRASPWLGYGGTRPSSTEAVPLGTHGQLWTVVYSHGIPAALFYVGFFAYAAWWSRNPRTPAGVAAHVTIVVGLTQVLYYGQLPHQLFVLMAAVAVSCREEPRAVPRVAAAW